MTQIDTRGLRDGATTDCYWLRDALGGVPAAECPPLEGHVDADVCIVGGGFTGLWTAIQIHDQAPSTSVVLLEADICGGAASGRNGGFAMSWWSKFDKLVEVCGTEEAIRLADLARSSISAIQAFCAAEGIDAQFRAGGWVWAASNSAQMGAWEKTVQTVGAAVADSPFELLDAQEARRRTGSDAVLGGAFEDGPASLHPARLARGLRAAALARGIRIHEHTRMTSFTRTSPATVRTGNGSVRADKLVLATHCGLAQVRELRRAVFVVSSDVLATVPIAGELAALGVDDGVSISDSRLLPIYYRSTVDGRLVFGKTSGILAFGGHLTARQTGPVSQRRRRELTSSLHRLYPGLAGAAIDSVWTGGVDRSANGLPYFGRLSAARNVLFGGGYSGNGVAPSYLGGRVLAALALELPDEWAAVSDSLRPNPVLPPEPIRFVGGRLVHTGIVRKERLEDAGRRPDPLSRFAATLVPATFVPVN
ncbi:NAD(P)/FAD-dependent oxidoreductase [Capillimicrobium parvum]|uniref:Gamma-glutamylputrescine oxidoreductase n=1 Tax=Capillimicrobium parvum TaxID=2884022 RepID=A0A9E6XTZ2_9ACTN|nr:FAD-dependent oxidoreductase [Capillimicrobium parvum]UGS34383.1 Gamma-glutamylputrescine oxidoreductase [Capillimicrobium parvum]